jgi:hypothetical protein
MESLEITGSLVVEELKEVPKIRGDDVDASIVSKTIGRFAAIAVPAERGKVLELIRATIGYGNYVVHL